MTWTMPLSDMNNLNSALVNDVPLSVTTLRGSPKVAKMICSFSIVLADVIEFIMCTSIHLEWASTNIRYIVIAVEQTNKVEMDPGPWL